MTESPDEAMPGRTAARWLSGILVTAVLWTLAVWLVPQLHPLRVPTTYGVLAAAGAVLVLAVRFATLGRDRVPLLGLAAGWAVWFGGACFVAIGVARFYAAAEWYRLVTPTVPNRVIAAAVILLVLCVAYAAWLKAARRALPEPAPLPVDDADEAAPEMLEGDR